MTRTQKSFYNMTTGLGATVLLVLLNFITRTVFIRTLGTSFLGIEGLFSNIFTMLSLADLGIGTAIVYKLYKPIEENDRPRIQVLMKLYRQVYWIIGGIIMVLGLCLIPLLPHLVEDYELFAELGLSAVLIFLIYLFDTAASYWLFANKASFVRANQKAYLLNIIGYATSLLSAIAQIAVLFILHDFVAYILVRVCFTVINGIVGAVICDRNYPYVNEKTKERVSKAELKEFAKDCSALLLDRIHSVVMNFSDNIVLSAVWGLDAVGLYYSYSTIRYSLRSFLDTILNSIQASLGSIHSTGNLEWSRLMFRVVNFLVFWLYGIGAIGLAVLLNEFIPVWLGSTDYLVTSWTTNGITVATPLAVAIGVEIYVIGQRQYFGTFRSSMGLFQQLKYRPVASILVNLSVLIPTVHYFGPLGCVISTIVAGLTTNMIIDPIVIFKHGLKTSVAPYFLRNALYELVVVIAGLLAWWVCRLIPLGGILGFLVHGCVCVAVPCCVFTLCFFRTPEFKYLFNTAKDLLLPKHTDK